MAFEETDTRAHATVAHETIASPKHPTRRAAPRETPVEMMMNFVIKSERVASELRGLALLFRGVFCDDETRVTDDASAAADIVDDVMKSIAARLDANADQARVARDHLARGGAR